MKKHIDGSALLLVLCIIAALSTLFLTLYRRSALVLLAAVEHEQLVRRQTCLDALMRYALIGLKKNWSYVMAQIAREKMSEHKLTWEITPGKDLPAYCIYRTAGEHACAIEVGVEIKSIIYKLSCRVTIENGNLVIDSWKEG